MDAVGKLVGRIRLPVVRANVCFSQIKRDPLVLTTIPSNDALHVNIQSTGQVEGRAG